MMTWLEACKLTPGTPVRFTEAHDIFPEGMVHVGDTGIVVHNDLNEASELLYILPDDLELRAALKEYGGEIYLTPHDEFDAIAPIEIIEPKAWPQ